MSPVPQINETSKSGGDKVVGKLEDKVTDKVEDKVEDKGVGKVVGKVLTDEGFTGRSRR